MDLSQLREKGGIIPPAPVKREVSWTHAAEDGSEVTDTFTVFVRKHSCGTIDRLAVVGRREGKDAEVSQRALVISESILLGEDGSERLSYEDAYNLDPGLAQELVSAINAVNSTGGAAPKN